MKKTAYLAPAIEIEEIVAQPLLPTVSGVGGNAGITTPEPGEDVPTEGDARRRHDVWEDEEEEEY